VTDGAPSLAGMLSYALITDPQDENPLRIPLELAACATLFDTVGRVVDYAAAGRLGGTITHASSGRLFKDDFNRGQRTRCQLGGRRRDRPSRLSATRCFLRPAHVPRHGRFNVDNVGATIRHWVCLVFAEPTPRAVLV
jgi:hypothetical protein